MLPCLGCFSVKFFVSFSVSVLYFSGSTTYFIFIKGRVIFFGGVKGRGTLTGEGVPGHTLFSRGGVYFTSRVDFLASSTSIVTSKSSTAACSSLSFSRFSFLLV